LVEVRFGNANGDPVEERERSASGIQGSSLLLWIIEVSVQVVDESA
jgi:hypothetical protein